ncbi:RNA polymerase sigma factor [Microbacterium sp. NPDC089189]|uniref:RNA polymerase sigma factor n=1 Tax=Microbacterium sp. NPDC089189 TaxID=3154972 RepID=UPI0034389AEB
MPESERPPSTLTVLSDRILVERAVDGDELAFREIVRRHSGIMRAYVKRITGSLADADDIVQDAFVTAWRQLPTLRDGDAVKAWLMRITSREALALVRRRSRETPLEDRDFSTPAQTQPEQVTIHNARLAALSAALDTLPDDQRRTWLLREVAGLSYGDIAEELDLPASTVRGNLARARASIMIRMEGWR